MDTMKEPISKCGHGHRVWMGMNLGNEGWDHDPTQDPFISWPIYHQSCYVGRSRWGHQTPEQSQSSEPIQLVSDWLQGSDDIGSFHVWSIYTLQIQPQERNASVEMSIGTYKAITSHPLTCCWPHKAPVVKELHSGGGETHTGLILIKAGLRWGFGKVSTVCSRITEEGIISRGDGGEQDRTL